MNENSISQENKNTVLFSCILDWEAYHKIRGTKTVFERLSKEKKDVHVTEASIGDLDHIAQLWDEYNRFSELVPPNNQHRAQVESALLDVEHSRVFVLKDITEQNPNKQLKGYAIGKLYFSKTKNHPIQIGAIVDLVFKMERPSNESGILLIKSIFHWFSANQVNQIDVMPENHKTVETFRTLYQKYLTSEDSFDAFIRSKID